MIALFDQKQYHKARSLLTGISILIAFLALCLFKLLNSHAAVNEAGDWPAYGRDAGGSRFSPLKQIDRDNIGQLKIAWAYRTGAEEAKAVSGKNAAFESTPILVDGLLYLTTPYNRVIALDPATGAERWTFDPQGPLDRRYSELTSRGVSAWPAADGGRKARRRIFVATIDSRLIALDAATGRPISDFGENGQVDLSRDGRPIFPIEERPVPQTDIPGERTSPTQPFPELPRPLVPHQLKPKDAWGLTDKDRQYCRDQIASLRSEGIYTPPSLKGTWRFPATPEE